MSEIDQNIFHSIQQLSRQLTKRLNEVLQPHGLFSAQWTVLFTLKNMEYLHRQSSVTTSQLKLRQ
ncbi:hypothetical protein MGI18_25485 [Bacillus sp. OVS6]|nr:hypothetical protein MGI18_25485 [Bacillus sp. OVS6]